MEVEVSLVPSASQVLLFRFLDEKTSPKPGSSLNPDDGEEGDDVNLECKTAQAPFLSRKNARYGFEGKPCRTLWTKQTCISIDSPSAGEKSWKFN